MGGSILDVTLATRRSDVDVREHAMNILLASPIHPEAIESLQQHHDVACAFGASEEALGKLAQDREALVFRSGVTISAEVIGRAPRLRLMVRAGSGLDNIDVEVARSRGVRVVRIPGPSAQAVAEFTFGLILSVARNVALGDRHIRKRSWPKPELGGPLLAGRTLGIVGVGNIGGRVGELAAAWGLRAIGCVARPSPERAAALQKRGIILADLGTVLAEADTLTLHVPLDESTYHMIDASSLARMKQGSYLINTARGGVVDEQALYVELTEHGRLRGAALDVHEHEGEGTLPPFAQLPNVVLTPHIAGMALESQEAIGRRVVELVGAFMEGRIEEETRTGELVV